MIASTALHWRCCAYAYKLSEQKSKFTEKGVIRRSPEFTWCRLPITMATLHKQAKEAFVSGLGGTSLWEVSLITVTLASGYVLRSIAVVCLPSIQKWKEQTAV